MPPDAPGEPAGGVHGAICASPGGAASANVITTTPAARRAPDVPIVGWRNKGRSLDADIDYRGPSFP